METNPSRDEIPFEKAYQLCHEINRGAKGLQLFFINAQCWGCLTFSKGDVEKMCFRNSPGNRGCLLINAKYDGRLS
jgi:hypothetical protein